jgi:hypothetical protein
MFFDKLFVRIKGELLSLKEDLSAEEDLRGRAEILLRRLEGKPGSGEENAAEGQSAGLTAAELRKKQTSRTDVPAELRKEWEDLMRRKEEKTATSDGDVPPPNPRELG